MCMQSESWLMARGDEFLKIALIRVDTGALLQVGVQVDVIVWGMQVWIRYLGDIDPSV